MVEIDPRTEVIGKVAIDAAIKVHRAFGPGLLESVYEHCLAHELVKREISVQKQLALPIVFDGERLEAGYRIDILVEGCVVVEVKAVDALLPIHQAQLLTYLRLSGHRLGFLMNFNAVRLVDGLKRMVA